MSDWICARQFITLADMEQLYDERVYNRPDQPMTASEIIARKHALLSCPDPTLPFDRWLAKATDAIEEHQRRRR
jgi:hypothetical protein